MKKLLKKLLIRMGGTKLYSYFQYYYWRSNLVNGRYRDEEIDIFPEYISPGDTVLDIGAHMGRNDH